MGRVALGLIETRGLIGVIEAADVAVKTADVRLLGFEQIGGGLVTLRFCGDVASVQAAVQAAAQAAERVGELISSHIIPRPHQELVDLLEGRAASLQAAPALAPTTPPPVPPLQENQNLEKLSVAHLRQLARSTPGLALKGRQISRANKQELLTAIAQAQQSDASESPAQDSSTAP